LLPFKQLQNQSKQNADDRSSMTVILLHTLTTCAACDSYQLTDTERNKEA